ncbi:hypothetical protein ACJRO7_020168 [Eucalyptus globulus]|uniref:Uncharacterized protein n=1 Tax=Eucalyptus globulus TaxID=34317 RepID=A0ABD3KHD5_EUCGL
MAVSSKDEEEATLHNGAHTNSLQVQYNNVKEEETVGLKGKGKVRGLRLRIGTESCFALDNDEWKVWE